MYQRCMGDIHSKGVCKKVTGRMRMEPAEVCFQPEAGISLILQRALESELSLQGKFYLESKDSHWVYFHSKHLETVR